MKKHSQFMTIIIALFTTFTFVGAVKAQTDEPNYAFVIFEAAVTRQGVETDDAHPEERRFYVSNVVAIPSNDASLFRRAKKLADDYFTANVVEPMKAKGISHDYYDDGIRINDDVIYRLDTRADVEGLRTKVLNELKEHGVNIFTFTWAYGEKSNGISTSKPTLFYREPKMPLYDEKTLTKPTKAHI